MQSAAGKATSPQSEVRCPRIQAILPCLSSWCGWAHKLHCTVDADVCTVNPAVNEMTSVGDLLQQYRPTTDDGCSRQHTLLQKLQFLATCKQISKRTKVVQTAGSWLHADVSAAAECLPARFDDQDYRDSVAERRAPIRLLVLWSRTKASNIKYERLLLPPASERTGYY